MHAGVSTGMVFAANVLVRILARLVNRRTTSPTEIETSYQVRVICREADETHIRTLLLYLVNSMALTLHALSSADMDGLPQVEVKAEFSLMSRFVTVFRPAGVRSIASVLPPGVQAMVIRLLAARLARLVLRWPWSCANAHTRS